MEFLSSDRTTFSRQVRSADSRRSGQNDAIIWAAMIVILAALCAFSWTFCMYVFGRPEKAFNYNLLIDLEKLPKLKDYQPSNAPRGKFHTPRDLYQLYFNHNPRALRALSAVLRRQYVTNFNAVERVTYLRGNYLIEQIHRLGPKDVFPSGLVLRGRAEDYPNVWLEYVLPADSLPETDYDLLKSSVFEVGTSSVCAAVINVSKVGDDQLIFTAVPIVYGSHEALSGITMMLQPPERLNLYGEWPITSGAPAETVTASANP